MDTLASDSRHPENSIILTQDSNGSSQLDALNNLDAGARQSLSPAREQTSNEAEESEEFRRIKVIPNGSLVRIILNNRNSKGKAASYLGGEATVVSSASNGMGGWHEVRTTDGKLLKLQRNSLVIQSVNTNERDQCGEQLTAKDSEAAERRPRQKRSAQEIVHADLEVSPKRYRRQTARVPAVMEASETASAFARNVSRDSLVKYARMHDIHSSGNTGASSWRRLLERCSQHYNRQKAVESNEIPNLLISVHLALKKDRCRLKEPR